VTNRAGYVMKYPDGLVVKTGVVVNDSSKFLARQVAAFGAKISWGPVVPRVPKQKAKARTRAH